EMVVSSGGIVIGTTVDSGGTLVVMSGAQDSGVAYVADTYLSSAVTTVGNGGTEIVLGFSNQVALDSGGLVVVSSGGRASASQIGSGGVEVVSSGGGGVGAVVSRGGGGGGRGRGAPCGAPAGRRAGDRHPPLTRRA